MNTEATSNLIREERPDVLVVAVGPEYEVLAELAKGVGNFMSPKEVLFGMEVLDERVVVAGGDL